MIHALHRVRTASLVCVAVLFVLAVFADSAAAGQQRAQSPIPPRLLKVKEGDWILVRTGDDLLKETATEISDIRPEVKPGEEGWFEPVYMVEYTLEKFDGETGQPIDKPMNVVRALEHEQEENAELLKTMRGKPQQRKIAVDGKNITVVVIPQQEEDGTIVENWFSGDIGIDGRVAIIVRMPESKETYNALEAVAFGNAKQQMNLRKYLRKKVVDDHGTPPAQPQQQQKK